MNNYEYFENVDKNAAFIEDKCHICGKNDNCLDGVYFDQEGIKAVCMSCFDKGAVSVYIPGYIKSRVINDVEVKAEKLSHNPPVPWVQNNDWQVCCDDFMLYIGEWEQSDFIKAAGDCDVVEYFYELLCDSTKAKVDDINVLWEDIGYDTVAYVFKCKKCNKIKVICQSY